MSRSDPLRVRDYPEHIAEAIANTQHIGHGYFVANHVDYGEDQPGLRSTGGATKL